MVFEIGFFPSLFMGSKTHKKLLKKQILTEEYKLSAIVSAEQNKRRVPHNNLEKLCGKSVIVFWKREEGEYYWRI